MSPNNIQMKPYNTLNSEEKRARLLELLKVFFKLGTTAFGGPAAHIAMMEEEFVQKRKWLDKAHFLDLLSATNLIPGPNSTELAIHIGLVRGGWLGLIIAGSAFILPAFSIVLVLAMLYMSYGNLPVVDSFMAMIQPAVLSIIVLAVWRLVKGDFKNYLKMGIFIAALILNFVFKVPEIPLLLGFIALALLTHLATESRGKLFSVSVIPMLFLSFLKIGSVLYGSGYVLVAFLESEFVIKRHLITSQQLLDAIATGQFTPGPVFTTATFLGYVMGGFGGAIVATIGIFLPAFVLVAVISPYFEKLRHKSLTKRVLLWLNTASIALMASVSMKLAQGSLTNPQSILVFMTALIVQLKFKINTTWIILVAGLLGVLKTLF